MWSSAEQPGTTWELVRIRVQPCPLSQKAHLKVRAACFGCHADVLIALVLLDGSELSRLVRIPGGARADSAAGPDASSPNFKV